VRANTQGFIRIASSAAAALLILAGCANSSWEGAREKNTVGAYHQFLRDHPDSRYSAEARERLAFLRVKTLPTLEAFEEFQSVYPGSPLTAELRDVVEPLYFEQARARNSSASYNEFLDNYPSGHLTAKGRGNLFYVENVRDQTTPEKLRGFIAAHPDSDFVPEAQRTLSLLESQRSTRIRSLGVRVDVAPNVVQANRVRRGFAAVVARRYREAGVDVQVIPPGEGIGGNMDAWMRIDYHEAPASGTFGGRTLLSHCRVRLYHKDLKDPVWDRKFDAPADHVLKGAYGRDKTVFGNSKYRFWERFFVPVSTWAASESLVNSKTYLEEVMNLHVQGERAALLLDRGGVDFIDVSSPLNPRVTDRYRRESDLAHWSGIKILDDRYTMIYGEDGAELLRKTDLNIEQAARWDVSEVGFVRGVAVYDSRTVFLAGTKGLFAIRLNQKPLVPHRLLDREVVGVAANHPYVYVIRPSQVEVATAKHLLRHLTGTKLPLGSFKATRARVSGDSIFLFGKTHIAEVSIADAQKPALVSLLETEKLGSVSDLALGDGHLYVLGARGLQIADPKGQWVSDTIQVSADQRVQLKGRFAFLVGGRDLEILDLSPYRSVAASPASAAD
jgi:hypothetical protein